MARTWVYQDAKQVAKHGEKKAAWYAAWIDPAGKQRCKSCGPGSRGKRDAERLAEKIGSQLNSGTYDNPTTHTWDRFKEDYEEKVMAKMKEGNRTETAFALKCFERIIGPKRVSAITTQDIDEYVAKRSAETKGSTVREGKGPQKRKRTTNRISPASVNKELRYLRAALRKANKWGLLPQLPEFTFLKVPVKVPTFISPEDFAALYDAAPKATRPDSQFFPAGDWWRALLVTAYMTGWRISEILTLRWEDVDLEAGTAFLRAENTKGNREDFVRLHPIVVDHMRKLKNFSPVVFPWMDAERRLWREFYDLQDMAKIKPRGKPHYGFHDLRRGFATMNADRLSADTLQRMMRHKSYSTTQLYVNMARQIQSSVDKLFVPELKPTKTAPRILG